MTQPYFLLAKSAQRKVGLCHSIFAMRFYENRMQNLDGVLVHGWGSSGFFASFLEKESIL